MKIYLMQVGDTVIVRKAAEIIPEILSVVIEQRPDGTVPFEIPDKCPVCGAPAFRGEDGADIRCSGINCPAQLARLIIHFASRGAMDIDGFGPAVVHSLMDKGYIKDIADIFYLKDHRQEFLASGIISRPRKEQTLCKDGRPRQQKKADYTDSTDNLLTAIERAKEQNLERLINGFGIPNIGKHTGKILEENFPDIYAIGKISYDNYRQLKDAEKTLKKEYNKIAKKLKLSEDPAELEILKEMEKQLKDVEKQLRENGNLKGIGEVSIKAIATFFSEPQTQTMLARLEKAGVNMTSRVSSKIIDKRFEDATFVLTGTLPTLSRDEAKNLIEEHGGRVAGSVSKKTTYLLAGENAGSKLTTAQSLDVKIITEDELMEMIS